MEKIYHLNLKIDHLAEEIKRHKHIALRESRNAMIDKVTQLENGLVKEKETRWKVMFDKKESIELYPGIAIYPDVIKECCKDYLTRLCNVIYVNEDRIIISLEKGSRPEYEIKFDIVTTEVTKYDDDDDGHGRIIYSLDNIT